MSLRKKNKKKRDRVKTTLDAEHKTREEEFIKRKNTLESKKERLSNLERELVNLNSKIDEDCTKYELTKKYRSRYEIKRLESDVKKISDDKEEIEYYFDVSDILSEYYNKKSRSKETIQPIIDDDITSSISDEEENHGGQISKLLKIEKRFNKEELLDDYLSKTVKSHVSEKKQKIDKMWCKICNREKTIIQSEGEVVCTWCGSGENIIIDSDKPNYKDMSQDNAHYCYKRINHFNEYLSQVQAKESTDIPQDVYDSILLEIKKRRIDNLATLTKDKLRVILKKLKLNKFYEHIPYIINKINGLPAPKMSREMENKLRTMFKEMQGPFMVYCPSYRKNFLSYSYVLHKMCQLLGKDEFLPCFPLLKSREKLHLQDVLWKKICKKLLWQFISSIK
jgi:hypothetical protein